ncbi:MAG: hypothetical protein M3373_07760 [Gemmatimonadota bacterium]|nr:hypothetical protein [Gemmatimonadota bacterium]
MKREIAPRRDDRYSPPLQVTQFISTKRGDPDRGPLIRMRSDEAWKRLLVDGELVWVYGPRRHDLATLEVDDALPRGAAVVRDIAGLARSETVRVVKLEVSDAPPRGPTRLA